MASVAQIVQSASDSLRAISESPKLDAELLLRKVLGRSASWLRIWPDAELSADDVARFLALLAQRQAGRPMAYILGEREFWSLRLNVNDATLIPRPDTELLVELALTRIPDDSAVRLADLGTGSGAIALALAHERPLVQVVATDASEQALQVARENALRAAIAHVRFVQGYWYVPLGGQRFDLIVSNPPYIADNDPHLARGDVRFEPRSALTAGPDGLDDLRTIIAGAPAHLTPGGHLLVEHGYDQAARVCALFADAGFIDVESHQDLGGNDRVVSGRLPC